jgi:hypothetical protein
MEFNFLFLYSRVYPETKVNPIQEINNIHKTENLGLNPSFPDMMREAWRKNGISKTRPDESRNSVACF